MDSLNEVALGEVPIDADQGSAKNETPVEISMCCVDPTRGPTSRLIHTRVERRGACVRRGSTRHDVASHHDSRLGRRRAFPGSVAFLSAVAWGTATAWPDAADASSARSHPSFTGKHPAGTALSG
jgi:hypothetical protein